MSEAPKPARYKNSSFFGPFISYEEKSYKTWTPGVNVIKIFMFVYINICNKLECPLQASLMLVSKVRSYMKEAPRPARYKNSSLFGPFESYEEKSFKH